MTGYGKKSGIIEMKGCMRYSALVRWDGERQNRTSAWRSLLVFLSLVFQCWECQPVFVLPVHSFLTRSDLYSRRQRHAPRHLRCYSWTLRCIYLHNLTFYNAIISPTTSLTFASILTTPIQTDDSSLELYRLNISPLNSSPVYHEQQ